MGCKIHKTPAITAGPTVLSIIVNWILEMAAYYIQFTRFKSHILTIETTVAIKQNFSNYARQKNKKNGAVAEILKLFDRSFVFPSQSPFCPYRLLQCTAYLQRLRKALFHRIQSYVFSSAIGVAVHGPGRVLFSKDKLRSSCKILH